MIYATFNDFSHSSIYKGSKLSAPVWGVSSVPFPFRFPFPLDYELVSSGISLQSVKNILKWRVTQNERYILVLPLLSFREMTSELIAFNHSRGTRTGY